MELNEETDAEWKLSIGSSEQSGLSKDTAWNENYVKIT